MPKTDRFSDPKDPSMPKGAWRPVLGLGTGRGPARLARRCTAICLVLGYVGLGTKFTMDMDQWDSFFSDFVAFLYLTAGRDSSATRNVVEATLLKLNNYVREPAFELAESK